MQIMHSIDANVCCRIRNIRCQNGFLMYYFLEKNDSRLFRCHLLSHVFIFRLVWSPNSSSGYLSSRYLIALDCLLFPLTEQPFKPNNNTRQSSNKTNLFFKTLTFPNRILSHISISDRLHFYQILFYHRIIRPATKNIKISILAKF